MWKLIFLAALLLRFVWDLTLTLLSNKQVGKPLPNPFKVSITMKNTTNGDDITTKKISSVL